MVLICVWEPTYILHTYIALLLKKMLEERGHAVVIAPPFYWGICQSTGGFIGSFKMRKETAKAMLFDIIASLAEFGFKKVFGINAHGDIEHSVTIIEAFREASEQLEINACYTFDEQRLQPFGLSGNEPYLCTVKPQAIIVSKSAVSDVHAGDIETATIHEFYPSLVDVERARQSEPVTLNKDRVYDWLFGGHIKELSPNGYLGSPADFEDVDVQKNIDDYACRISEAIMKKNFV